MSESLERTTGLLLPPRCYDHKQAKRLPVGCRICTRIAVEHRLVRMTVTALLDAGYALAPDDGTRFFGAVAPSRDRDTVYRELMNTDDEYLGVFLPHEATTTPAVLRPFAWVRFVYGNDGFDVISDYTLNIKPQLATVLAYADRLADGEGGRGLR